MNGGNQPAREAAVLREMKDLAGSITRLTESVGELNNRLISVSRSGPIDEKLEVRKETECPLAGELADQIERIDGLTRHTQSIISALEI